MPFTFSHPAIVLPLNYLPKKWISLTGLVIGSLTPDFEYFIHMRIQSVHGHTISGIFWYDLLLGLLLAFLFHNLVRNQLFHNLPVFLQSRLSVFTFFNWNTYFMKNWIVVMLSILIGATSHIFWDSFTHHHGYFVKVIPVFRETFDAFGIQVPIFKVMQHFSTLFGGIVIIYALYKLPVHSTELRTVNKNYWLTFFLVTLMVVTIRFMFGLTFQQFGNVIVTLISASLISLILTPILISGIYGNKNPKTK